MQNDIEEKNKKGMSIVFLMLFTLFLPIVYNDENSFSLLSYPLGKLCAVLLLVDYIIFLKGLKRIYLKIFTLTVVGLIIFQSVVLFDSELIKVNIPNLVLVYTMLAILIYITFCARYFKGGKN